MDEMAIKPAVAYEKAIDNAAGFVDTRDPSPSALSNPVAGHPLCFVYAGLSTSFRVLVTYYFTKGLHGAQLYGLLLNVLRQVEGACFHVMRAVANNQRMNVTAFNILQ